MKTTTLRWPAYLTLAAYTLVMKVLPYALPRLGVEIDHSLDTYPWNFSPVLAFCLYGGAALPRRSLSLWAPLVIWFLGDLGIWALTGRRDWAFYPAQAIVYVALAACSTCGWLLRHDRTWSGVSGMALLTPCLFYALTNAACWWTSPSYPQSTAGLIQCYGDGLVHHIHLLISTLLFCGVMFSPLGVADAKPSESPQPAPVA
jgi:hypothetical protein